MELKGVNLFAGAIAVKDLSVKGGTGFQMAVDYRCRILLDGDVIARIGTGALNPHKKEASDKITIWEVV